MSSRDTIVSRITKKTKEELDRIRECIASDLGIDKDFVTQKHAEIALRIKASRGRLFKSDLNGILLGKIQ